VSAELVVYAARSRSSRSAGTRAQIRQELLDSGQQIRVNRLDLREIRVNNIFKPDPQASIAEAQNENYVYSINVEFVNFSQQI